MKKLRNYYLSALLITGLGFMSGCGDDNDDPKPVTPAKEMNTYTAKILGNQQASAGSFFATSDGSIYTSTNAKANAANIDIVYYYSTGGTAAVDSATIAGPSDLTAQDVYKAPSSSADIPTWATKNITTFKYLGTSAATFTSLTNGDEIDSVYTASTATVSTSVNKLEVNDVFAFKTAAGKHGVARVTNLTRPVATTTPAFQSSITIDVKVSK